MTDLQHKSPVELDTMAQELRAKIRDARFSLQMRQNGKTHVLRDMRHDLARVLTTISLRSKNSPTV